MIKSKTNLSLELDGEIKDYLNILHENVNQTFYKTNQLQEDITDKIYEINSMIQTYNDLCNFIEENLEEANQMLGEQISTFADALHDKESILSEQAYNDLDCWISDWKDFNAELKDLDWITTAEEVDGDDDVFSQNTEDSLKELERHICYNQPSHSINVEVNEEETA